MYFLDIVPLEIMRLFLNCNSFVLLLLVSFFFFYKKERKNNQLIRNFPPSHSIISRVIGRALLEMPNTV